MVSKLLLVTL